MDDLLNQLIGLCAGRVCITGIERKRLLQKFRNLPSNQEHMADYRANSPVCMMLTGVLADSSTTESVRRSFLKPWEQPDHGIVYRHRGKIQELTQPTQHDEIVEIIDRFQLLQARRIDSTITLIGQIQVVKSLTIPPPWSREHNTSFPAALLPAALTPCGPHYHKTDQGYGRSAKSMMDVPCCEDRMVFQDDIGLQSVGVRLDCFDDQSSLDRCKKVVSNGGRNHKSRYCDDLDAEVSGISVRLINARKLTPEIVLGERKPQHRIKVIVDATAITPEELVQARQSTSTRGYYGLPFKYPEAGRVDVF